jgi:hypothetical protein
VAVTATDPLGTAGVVQDQAGQSDRRPYQIRIRGAFSAQLRRERGALLAGTHDRERRPSDPRRAPALHPGLGRRRPGRSAGHGPGTRRGRGHALHRLAGSPFSPGTRKEAGSGENTASNSRQFESKPRAAGCRLWTTGRAAQLSWLCCVRRGTWVSAADSTTMRHSKRARPRLELLESKAMLSSAVRLLQGTGLTNVVAFNTNGLLNFRIETATPPRNLAMGPRASPSRSATTQHDR